MLEDNRFLGGHLVGIGKRKANGEIIYQELDKPVHNRIMSVGLDHLLVCGGPDKPNAEEGYEAETYLWSGTYNSASYGRRSGALHWMAFGNGTAATAFTDTALGNKISTYYSTKCTSSESGQKLNGTKWTTGADNFGKFSFRVSHESTAVSETTTINEIGWFGGYGSSTNDLNLGATPVLFARVLLPSPITLLSGEKLITTYQLDETNANATETTGTSFFGLLDTNGNALQYKQRLVRRNSSSGGWGGSISEPRVTSQGGGDNYNICFHAAFQQISPNRSDFATYTTTSSDTLPSINSSYAFSNGTTWDYGTVSSTVSAYTQVGETSKFRDRVFMSGAYNPNMAGDPSGKNDIRGIILNGMGYLFGYEENGSWVSQAWRKYANKQVTFTFRTRYTTTV